MQTFLQQLINGLSLGAIYALIALGYTMVYGVLRLINFAHSDVYMFGAYMGYYLANSSIIKENFGDTVLGAAVQEGRARHPQVTVSMFNIDAALFQVKIAEGALLPTLNLLGNAQKTINSTTSLATLDTLSASVAGQLAVPIYQGGAISSREREAAALYEKSKQDLEAARRTTALSARQSYLAVINGIAQVGALEQAFVSSTSALESNKLGYEVGVRINIDVLNAQQQLYSTRRDLAVARYNTITSHLKLKAAAGSLRDEDLEEVNRALAP